MKPPQEDIDRLLALGTRPVDPYAEERQRWEDHRMCEVCHKIKFHVIRRIDLRDNKPFLCDDCHEVARENEPKV